MPNKLKTQLARDVVQILDQIKETATWGGDDYDCVISEPDVDINLEDGGFMPSGDFTVKFLRTDFNNGAGPFPQHDDQVTYDGQVYKITSITNKVDHPWVKLTIAR